MPLHYTLVFSKLFYLLICVLFFRQIKINNAMASTYANVLQSRRKESSYLLTEEFTFYEKLAISEESDQGKIYF